MPGSSPKWVPPPDCPVPKNPPGITGHRGDFNMKPYGWKHYGWWMLNSRPTVKNPGSLLPFLLIGTIIFVGLKGHHPSALHGVLALVGAIWIPLFLGATMAFLDASVKYQSERGALELDYLLTHSQMLPPAPKGRAGASPRPPTHYVIDETL